MSASPSGQSNGQTPTPNGGPTPMYTRKPKPADPFQKKRKPVRRPPPPKNPAAKHNGLGLQPARPIGLPTSVNGVGYAPSLRVTGSNGPKAAGGWTKEPTGPYHDFPLMTTKKALAEGFRHHIMRFTSKKDINPANQDEFTRPVSLHRRDPRQPPPGKAIKEDEMPDDGLDSKEREKLEILKAEKEARRAADQAQIAPTGNNASALAAKKAQAFRNEKTTQVHRLDKTEAEKKQSDLRYEEALPWHLEDAESKNTWVGNYEAALSDVNVMLVIEGGVFRMIPIEKWYKFTPKNQFKTLSIDEAEALLNKPTKESRWAMKTQEKQDADKASRESRKSMYNLYTVKSESTSFKGSSKNEIKDIDELDFAEDDLFQDDDEQATFEPDRDEDTVEAQQRIKQDQRGANLFGEADEAEIEKDFVKEEKEEEERKKLGKGVRKAMIKREKNYIYDSDSSNPYASSSSDDDTSDDEKQKEIDKKKDEAAKLKAKEAEKNKAPSGTSSKGTNTPSGRPKHIDALKKSKTLKRPGSPNLSESSETESRKKHKKKHLSSTGTSTPIPGSRPMSPAPSGSQPAPAGGMRKSSIVKLNVNPSKLSEIQSAPPHPSPIGGHMSDGEATGGETSDGGKKKKIKLRVGGPSLPGSRVGSPAPGRAGSIGAGGSRAGSPIAQAQAIPRTDSPGAGQISAEEVIAAVRPEGITLGELLKAFPNRVGEKPNQTTKKDFINMVKVNLSYGADKLLHRK